MTSCTARQTFRELVAQVAAKAKATLPECNGRVEKAVRLVLQGDVELHADRTATVYSSPDPTRRYEIVEGTCGCRDYEQAPHHFCQHRIAAGIHKRVGELLPAEPEPVLPDLLEPWPDNDVEPAPDAPPVEPEPTPRALPEAPASVNVRLTIAGREVQWTLRDHDEARLATRLEALLARYPVTQPPVQPSSTAEGWCRTHGLQMTQSHKDGRSWWSHKTPEGQWCKGK